MRKVIVKQETPEVVHSFSSINTFKRCRMLYYYTRIRKLQRKTTPLPLKKGSVVHLLLETWLKGGDWREKLEEYRKEYNGLMDEEKLYYGDLPFECNRIMEGYVEFWKDIKVETLGVELAFGMDGKPPLEITEGVYMKGKIDWVFRDDRGIWVADHKTVGREIPTESYRLGDLQTVIYAKALPMLGFPRPVGVMFDYLKTKLPTPPTVLKNGGISRAKNCTADYGTYLKTILDNKLNPDDYKVELENAKRNLYYARKYIAKPKELATTLIEELKIVDMEVKLFKDKPYRNLGRDCNTCGFQSLCTAEMLGLDTSFMLKADYEVRKPEEAKAEDGNEEKEDD